MVAYGTTSNEATAQRQQLDNIVDFVWPKDNCADKVMMVDLFGNGGDVTYVDCRIVSQKISISMGERMDYLHYMLEVAMKTKGGQDLRS